MLLLASLSCWILFTLPLGFIQPPATSCLVVKNETFVIQPIEQHTIRKREIHFLEQTMAINGIEAMEPSEFLVRKTRSTMRSERNHGATGQSPQNVNFAVNYNKKEHFDWVAPLFSSIIYRTPVSSNVYYCMIKYLTDIFIFDSRNEL